MANCIITLKSYTHSKHQLSMNFGIDDLSFTTSYWYNDVDLLGLEYKFGSAFMEKVYFHIMAFEVNKLTSLKPDFIDLGIFKQHHTVEFEKLWLTIQRNVWAQWRYENDFSDYLGPKFLSQPIDNSVIYSIQFEENNTQVLSFCGGGKDSLVSLKLLEKLNIPYASCAYSSSVYGRSQVQHQLIENLLKNCSPIKQHKIWMYEDFLESPILELEEYGVKSLTAAETPSSIFASLPIILQHRYRYINLGHEYSADFPNLIWEKTGESINHQWGKSTEAENLLNAYLQTEFISNIYYFSLLKPIYDVVIFNLLRQDLKNISLTHSCNTHKPWCKKCAKCAYIWLNYMAYLPVELVNQIFEINLFDVPENQLWFRQMLGLEKHTPFECIGQVEEAKLAFELCRRKNLTGKAMNIFIEEVKNFDFNHAIENYAIVNYHYYSFPPFIAKSVFSELAMAAVDSKAYIQQFFK